MDIYTVIPRRCVSRSRLRDGAGNSSKRRQLSFRLLVGHRVAGAADVGRSVRNSLCFLLFCHYSSIHQHLILQSAAGTTIALRSDPSQAAANRWRQNCRAAGSAKRRGRCGTTPSAVSRLPQSSGHSGATRALRVAAEAKSASRGMLPGEHFTENSGARR